MRKACIQLCDSRMYVSLDAGSLGGGRCLYFFDMNANPELPISAERWKKALGMCLAKAKELKYEVGLIRGFLLTSEKRTMEVALMEEQIKTSNYEQYREE